MIKLYPTVCPRAVIHVISPIIRDRVVCDLGCGPGYMMELLLEFGAKRVNGIENKEGLLEEALAAGYDVVLGDIIDDELPQAEVYWNWTPMPVMVDVINKIKNAIIIVGDMKGQDNILDQFKGLRLAIPFNENNIEGIYSVTVIDKRINEEK